MVEVFTSRSGVPTARVRGVALHSPYDPLREAQRFVGSLLGSERPSAVVVLGEGLGYVSQCVAGSFPSARLVIISYSTEIFRACRRHDPAIDAWHPEAGKDLGEFLRERIGELDVEGLRVVEWPPSARLFPGQSRAANEELQQCLREANGSLVTTMAMGKLWLRNSIANFLSLGRALRGAACTPERPVVIAASGPSLERAAPLLRDARHRVDLWALPSSALFLREAGLAPDLIIMTDPGFYAMHHLHHAAPACPVAMPLSAARGLWQLPVPAVFLLAQPGLVEEELVRALGFDAPPIPPHGTVAATALDLALASTRGPVIFAGLDLCTADVLSHARPSEFERFVHLRCSRTAPADSQWFRRSADQEAARIPGGRGARAPLSLRTYAGWLGRGPGRGKAFRLLPSVVDLPGLVSLDAPGFRELLRSRPRSDAGPQLFPHPALPPRAQRTAAAREILAGWRARVARGLADAEADRQVLVPGPLADLSYQIATQRLLEARRRARLGDPEGARESAVAALEESDVFLAELLQKVPDAV